jgi:hypothetical protein
LALNFKAGGRDFLKCMRFLFCSNCILPSNLPKCICVRSPRNKLSCHPSNKSCPAFFSSLEACPEPLNSTHMKAPLTLLLNAWPKSTLPSSLLDSLFSAFSGEAAIYVSWLNPLIAQEDKYYLHLAADLFAPSVNNFVFSFCSAANSSGAPGGTP